MGFILIAVASYLTPEIVNPGLFVVFEEEKFRQHLISSWRRKVIWAAPTLFIGIDCIESVTLSNVENYYIPAQICEMDVTVLVPDLAFQCIWEIFSSLLLIAEPKKYHISLQALSNCFLMGLSEEKASKITQVLNEILKNSKLL